MTEMKITSSRLLCHEIVDRVPDDAIWTVLESLSRLETIRKDKGPGFRSIYSDVYDGEFQPLEDGRFWVCVESGRMRTECLYNGFLFDVDSKPNEDDEIIEVVTLYSRPKEL